MANFVYGTKDRIFINTSLGCRAGCKYCYLPQLGLSPGAGHRSAGEVIALVEQCGYYVPGKAGSIISLGCYSECMDVDNIEDTKQAVSYFLGRENWVQLSTKQRLPEQLCASFSAELKFPHQLEICISMPTYSLAQTLEPGAAPVTDRIANIALCRKYGLDALLYIKPYLPHITSTDLPAYEGLAAAYGLPVVVGGILSVAPNGNLSDVGERRLYEQEASKEMEAFKRELQRYTATYSHSTQHMEEMRRNSAFK